MSNYYEILNLTYSATRSEIEQALDAQYNQIRRLITHHDPNIVNQANSDLQVLEKIRSTLMDSSKRSAYDAAIFPQMGGLMDPEVSAPLSYSQPGLLVGNSQPLSSPAQPITPASAQRNWICPKCQSVNLINSQYCKHCGDTLAAPCPACARLVERNAEFCSNCGVNIVRAQEKKELEQQLVQVRSELQRTSKNVPLLDKNIPELNKLTVRGATWTVVSLIAALTFLLASPGEHPGIDLSGPIQDSIAGTKFRPIGMGDYALVFTGVVILIVTLVSVAFLRKSSPLSGLGAILAGIFFMIGPKTVGYLLISSDVGQTPGALLAMIIIIFFYAFAFKKILSITRKYFAILKPYYSRLPKSGFIGTLFSWMLSATPALYSLFVVIIAAGLLNEFSVAMDKYQSRVLQINGIQLIILSALLVAFTLMGLRTAQAGEVRYRQDVSARSEKTERLTRQIQSLEQAISQVDLHSR